MSFTFPKKFGQETSRQYPRFDPRDRGFDVFFRPEKCPPCYSDLGKRAWELFNTGYHFGLLCLNVITKTPNNVKFTTTCSENISQGNLFGSVEAKYELPDAFVLTERWNTDCTLTTEFCWKNKPFNGFGVNFSGSISPRTGDRVGILKAELKNKFCCLNSQIDVNSKFSTLTTSAVVGYHGLLGGVLAKFDTYSYKMSEINFAAGFSTSDFILHSTFNNGSECRGSIFHKVSPNAEAGVEVIFTGGKKSDVLFGLAGRYQLDDEICFKGKINNSNQLGVSFEQRIRECVILNWSVLFDIKNFENGKHNFGLSIQFES